MRTIHPLPSEYILLPEVARARQSGLPMVAFESTVITHGLPRPENLQLAREVETVVRTEGVTPATIAILDGHIHVGLTADELEALANHASPRKISPRDLSAAISARETGGTTVAGTLVAAHAAGINVFSTGGIGGVHREAAQDVSADLPTLGRTPLVVVCAGAKAILDLPATLEYLETVGVPVVGYQTNEFPAFYCRSSGLSLTIRRDTPEEIAQLAHTQWELGLPAAILVVQPPPEEAALPNEVVETAIHAALQEARAAGVKGAKVTPFLLDRVSHLTGGASLRTNLALLRNNARLAGQIAKALAKGQNPGTRAV